MTTEPTKNYTLEEAFAKAERLEQHGDADTAALIRAMAETLKRMGPVLEAQAVFTANLQQSGAQLITAATENMKVIRSAFGG